MRLRKPRKLSLASVSAERYALSAYTSADVLAWFKSPSNFRLSCVLASVTSYCRISLCLASAFTWFFVAVEALAVLLGPARVFVLLPVFRRVLLPRLRRLASLHVVILVAAVALFGNRHDRGINHLAAPRNVALRLQMLAKALEQLLNQTGLRKRLSEQPQRRAVRNAVLDAKPQKPRERQPVAHLILDLFVRQIVKRLQHQHTKYHHDVDRLAAGAALLLIRRRQNRHLDLGSQVLERHHASNHFQRIALRRNRRKPPLRIKESKLPHRPTPANLVVSQIRLAQIRGGRYFSRCPFSAQALPVPNR